MATSTNKVKPVKLKAKQEKFCINYLRMGNATQAAIAAGYSPKYVATNTTKLLKNTKIAQRLMELNEKVQSSAIMDVQERKERLSEIARARLTDFMELGADGSWVNIGPETKGSAAIQEIHSRTEYDKDGNAPTIYTSVKLHDAMKAIDLLNKMDKIYAEGLQVNIDNRKIVVVYDDIPEYQSQIAPPASNTAEVH